MLDEQIESANLPRISVIVPVYNKGPHIARCLRSVLAQTFESYELIVVDDCSTDDSLEQVQAFQDSRIKFLHRDKPGPGGYAARNLGIKEAKAEWCAFLDADDAWDEGHLECIGKMISGATNDVGFLFSGFRISRNDGVIFSNDPYSARHSDGTIQLLDLRQFLADWIGFSNTPMRTSAVAIKKDVMEKIGSFPAQRCERGGDKDAWLRAMTITKAAFSGEVTVTYFTDAVSMVTRTADTNVAPCVCPTICRLLDDSNFASVHNLLRKVINREVLEHALLTSRTKNVSWSVLREFYVFTDPLLYLLLLVLLLLPFQIVRKLREIRRNLRNKTPG